MKKNLYNSKDDDHQHVLKLLKELPREKAHQNFEYNLRVKIDNQNFELNTGSDNSIFPWKILIPAAGTAIAAVLVFFTTFNNPETFDNPFQISPQPRAELGSNLIGSYTKLNTVGEDKVVSENDVLVKKVSQDSDKDINPGRLLEEKQNLAKSVNAKPDFPFDNSSSTNLDQVLAKKDNRSKINRRASLAGRSSPTSFFNGFFIREEVDKEYVVKLKARMDSLKGLKSKKPKSLEIAE